MEPALERRGQQHSRKMLISLHTSPSDTHFFQDNSCHSSHSFSLWTAPQTLKLSSFLRSNTKSTLCILTVYWHHSLMWTHSCLRLEVWLSTVAISFLQRKVHFNRSGLSFNRQVSHFYPVTSLIFETILLATSQVLGISCILLLTAE